MSIILKSGDSAATAGITAAGELKVALATGAFGSLGVSMDPTVAFYDTFEGTVLDTTNRWTLYGTVAPGQAQGNLNVNPGNTANASVALSSQPLIPINTAMILAAEIQFEAGTTATGNHRFWGLGTAPAGLGTPAAPLTDAIGFEVDVAGMLRASVYAGGSRIFTAVLTMSLDGAPHFYMVQARGDVAFFYKDDFTVPVAQSYAAPASQLLPMRMHSVNSAAVTNTPVMQTQGFTILDLSRQASQVADGTFPWRKAKVDAAGAQLVSIAGAQPVTIAGSQLITASPAPSITGGGPTSVTAAAADTLLLAANANRRGAAVTNDSTAVLYLSLGTTAASATAFTAKLAAGAYYEVPAGYSGALRGFWAAANGAARVTEVVAP